MLVISNLAAYFDGIYLEFAKAFDQVPHSKLLWKVANSGINSNILTWITNFFYQSVINELRLMMLWLSGYK